MYVYMYENERFGIFVCLFIWFFFSLSLDSRLHHLPFSLWLGEKEDWCCRHRHSGFVVWYRTHPNFASSAQFLVRHSRHDSQWYPYDKKITGTTTTIHSVLERSIEVTEVSNNNTKQSAIPVPQGAPTKYHQDELSERLAIVYFSFEGERER